MILTGKEIKQAVLDKDIVIIPFNEKLINPNSYNYHLGNTIIEFNNGVIDSKIKQIPVKHIIDSDGFELKPGKLYLSSTRESIGSKKYVTSLIGRSSVARLGIFLQITADLGQLGVAHKWTLEITVVQPIRVYPNMKIGQVTFWATKGMNKEFYTKGYTAFSDPAISRMHEEMM